MLAQLRLLPHTLGLISPVLLIRAAAFVIHPGTRRRMTMSHELGVVVFCLYLSLVCHITVNISRVLAWDFAIGHNYNLTPFAEISAMAAGSDTRYALINIVGNVILFFPLGLLLPLLWRGWNAHRVFLFSLALSSGIELLQLFTGRRADVDDIILNVIGSVTGFLVYRIIFAVYPRVTGAFRAHQHPKLMRQKEQGQSPPSTSGGRQQLNRPRAKQKRGVRKTAFLTTGFALLILVSGTVLLSGFIDTSAPPSPRIPGPLNMSQASVEMIPINSSHILLASADLSHILYQERAERPIYPASMTKMMTAVLALEQIADLEEVIFLRQEIFPAIYSANLSTAGFQPGEEARAIDLIYGLMLPSGAECAVALAEHIAGSETAFAALMNEKASELGMSETHFVNATGTHHPNHYTTALDMARLLRYGLENPAFRAVSASEWHRTGPTNLHPEGIDFASTLFGKVEAAFPGGMLLGGKTGYTDEAGQCLASFAEIGGREYLLITAGARPEDFRLQQLHIEDAIAVYGALREFWSPDVL